MPVDVIRGYFRSHDHLSVNEAIILVRLFVHKLLIQMAHSIFDWHHQTRIHSTQIYQFNITNKRVTIW